MQELQILTRIFSRAKERLHWCLNAEVRYLSYGDATNMIRPRVQVIFPYLSNCRARDIQLENAVRVSVEGSYMDMKQLWSLNDFATALMVGQAPTRLFYKAWDLFLHFETLLEAGGQA